MKNIGLIGCGYIGKAHAAGIKKSSKVKLAALVHSHEDAGKQAAAEYGCPYYASTGEMYANEDIDIVDICLPTFKHEQFTLEAAKNKKHVICEKPFSLSSESASRMIKACENAGVKLMVAQVLRWMPEFSRIRELYEKGAFGKPHMIYANRLAQHPNWSTWHRDPALSGGGLFDLHLHDIDYLYYLFGKVEEVYAVGWKSPTGCWNHVCSSLIFRNGVKAAVEMSFEMTDAFPFSVTFRITGDKATVDYGLAAGFNIENPEAASSRFILYEKGAKPQTIAVANSDAFQAEIEAFADAVEGGKPSPVPPEDSLYVIKIIEALRDSLESGTVRKVE
jgi:predicted dehydrogenase